MNKLFLFLAFCAAICNGQENQAPNPPSKTWIKWSEVTPYSFTVRWKAVPEAAFYQVELLNGYTIHQLRFHQRVKTTYFEFTELKPLRVYGVKVIAVDNKGRKSVPGTPARTRTKYGTTKATTTTPKPTSLVPVGHCGNGKFTCGDSRHGKKKCINAKLYCDGKFNCDDGSDERACPGGCEEITESNFPGGNFSCSKWASPNSYCFFSCFPGTERDGAWYIKCEKGGEWNRPIPNCLLSAPEGFEINEVGQNFVSISWDTIDRAAAYKAFVALVDNVEETTSIKLVDVAPGDQQSITIEGLVQNVNYMVWVVALSDNDQDGKTTEKLEFVTEEILTG